MARARERPRQRDSAGTHTQRGIPQDHIRLITYANALAIYGQSGQMQEEDWLAPAAIDQRTLYQGNTVLRGGQTPKVDIARQ